MGFRTQSWMALIAAAGLAGAAWSQDGAADAEGAEASEAVDAEASAEAGEAKPKEEVPPPAFTTVAFERLLAEWPEADGADDEAATRVGDCAAKAPAGSASLQARVTFAAVVLKGCDTVVATAKTADELLSAAAAVDGAHGALLGVWRSMAADLDTRAGDLSTPEGLAAYAQARQARKDVEAGLDGLRVLSRLAYAASQRNSYADPELLARAFAPSPDAPQNPVAEVDGEAVPAPTDEEGEPIETPEQMAARALSSRQGCAGIEKKPDGTTIVEWAFVSRDEDLEYGVVVPDLVAGRAAEFLETTLRKEVAPAFGFEDLDSYRLRRNCPEVKMRKFADETAADAAAAQDAPDPSLPQAPGRGG